MKAEMRVVKASLWTGITDLLFGVLMFMTGWGDWYYTRFHFFGIIGFSLIIYAYWTLFFMRRDGVLK